MSEALANGGVDYVSKPLFGQLVPFLFDRQILEASRVLDNECLDVLDSQGLVLGDSHMLDSILLDLLPRSGDEVLKEAGKELD